MACVALPNAGAVLERAHAQRWGLLGGFGCGCQLVSCPKLCPKYEAKSDNCMFCASTSDVDQPKSPTCPMTFLQVLVSPSKWVANPSQNR